VGGSQHQPSSCANDGLNTAEGAPPRLAPDGGAGTSGLSGGGALNAAAAAAAGMPNNAALAAIMASLQQGGGSGMNPFLLQQAASAYGAATAQVMASLQGRAAAAMQPLPLAGMQALGAFGGGGLNQQLQMAAVAAAATGKAALGGPGPAAPSGLGSFGGGLPAALPAGLPLGGFLFTDPAAQMFGGLPGLGQVPLGAAAAAASIGAASLGCAPVGPASMSIDADAAAAEKSEGPGAAVAQLNPIAQLLRAAAVAGGSGAGELMEQDTSGGLVSSGSKRQGAHSAEDELPAKRRAGADH
jgi:hypothetical protein